MPPVNGSWDFPLSRAEKTRLLLDLYTVEVQSSHFEIAKLRQESESSQELSVKAEGPSPEQPREEGLAPKPASPGLRQLELSSMQQSSESAGQEAAPRRRDAQPRWSWEERLCGQCRGCGSRQFLVAACKDCKAQYCGLACLRASLVAHQRSCPARGNIPPTRRRPRTPVFGMSSCKGCPSKR
mmetsp:Transcript_54332/g.112107  ORF Transcript_54332/g.112107 Transcript_54332/m.112107 type:complete len:183 (+) Transcript_54332:65-613(+)